MNAACTFSHHVDPRVLSHGPPFPYKALQGLHSALLVARIMHASYCTYIQTTLRHGGAGWRRRGLRRGDSGEGGERERRRDPGVNRETYPELPEPPVLTKGRHHHQSLSLDLLLLQDKLHTRQVTKRTRGEGQKNPPKKNYSEE